MATTITITKAYVDAYNAMRLTFAENLPAIRFNEQTNTAEEVEVNEIGISFRAVIAQIISVRPEIADMYAQIRFANDDKRAAMLSAFVRLITKDASWEVEAKRHSAGETFEDGNIARYDGYTYNIVGVTFAPMVEAKVKPKSVEDDLAMFGF